jgi:hypothetical protein
LSGSGQDDHRPRLRRAFRWASTSRGIHIRKIYDTIAYSAHRRRIGFLRPIFTANQASIAVDLVFRNAPTSGVRNSAVEMNARIGPSIVGSGRSVMSWKLGFKSVRSGPLVNFISGDSDSPGKSYTRIECCQRFVLPCPRPLPPFAIPCCPVESPPLAEAASLPALSAGRLSGFQG